MQLRPHDALFIDFDGTLVDLAAHPAAVKVAPELRTALICLHRLLQGALAVISGRPIVEIDEFLALPFVVAAAGVHGAEVRTAAGWLPVQPAAPGLDAARSLAAALASRHPALFVEQKSRSVAVHYRSEPALGALVRQAMDEQLDQLPGMKLQQGHQVLELKPSWADKGRAIDALMATAPFQGRRPVFIGDDVTDEDGFVVVNAAGGLSIKVGAGPSCATERLATPGAVREWLTSAVATLEET